MARDASSRTGLSDLALDQQHATLPAHVWAQAVNTHLDAFVALEPVFAQLYQLGAALALAKALHALAVPVSLEWVRLFAAPTSHTALRVPTAKNELNWSLDCVEQLPTGSRTVTTRYRYGLTGGIALAAPLEWEEDADENEPPASGLPGPDGVAAATAAADGTEEPEHCSGGRGDELSSILDDDSSLTGAGVRKGSAAARRLGVSDKAARLLGVAAKPTTRTTTASSKKLGAAAESATGTGASGGDGSKPASLLVAPGEESKPASTGTGRVPDTPKRNGTAPVAALSTLPASSHAAAASWAWAQSEALRGNQLPRHGGQGSGDLSRSGDLAAASGDTAADPDAFELPCLPSTAEGCAACKQPLLWTAAILERCGVAYCTRSECCAERGRAGSTDTTIVDPLGLSWEAGTVVTSSDKDVDDAEAESAASSALLSARPVSVLACHGCGEPLWPGEQYLTLSVASRGRVSYHNRVAGSDSSSQPPGAEALSALSPQKLAILTNRHVGAVHDLSQACMRCEAPGCGKALVRSKGSTEAAAGVTIAGRVVGPALLCNKHAAIADGYGDACSGCGEPLWHAPPADAAAAAAPASGGPVLSDEDGVLLRLSTLSLGSGERFHDGCFRCSKCGTCISGAYVKSEGAAGSAARSTFTCEACLKQK
jgi:hypothetical protein